MSGPDRDEEMRQVARQVLSELVPGILREVMSEPGRGAAGNGIADRNDDGNGVHPGRTPTIDQRPDPVPQVPAPPIAAVHRPSTWNRPAAPGEIIGQPGLGDQAPSRVHTQPTTAAPPGAAAPPAPVPPLRAGAPPAPTPAAQNGIANPGAGSRVEGVTIDTDEDLMQFARQLISRAGNPRDRLAIHTGKLRFTLRRRPVPAAAGAGDPPGSVTRIEKGAVTERVIRDAASAGTRLVLAPGTVLTPLARERARALGVEIERERRC